MCGIVGYIGNKDVHTVILVGLEKLEYRGYDSAGIAIITDDGELFLRKKAGRYKDLYKLLDNNAILGKIGIGHTRWATHGKVNDENAHPMVDCKNKIALVHNGIIENYQELKKSLIQKGHKFASETDTEVIVHLIEEFYNEDKSLIKAVIKTVNKLKGSFALGIISVYEPDKIIGVRKDSPLLVGIGENEMVLASDLVPIVSITKNIIEMENEEICVLYQDHYEFYDFSGNVIKKQPKYVSLEGWDVDKRGYPHFMLKEIFEQPEVLARNIRNYLTDDGYINLLGSLGYLDKVLPKKRIYFQACGTSLHAGLVGEYLFSMLPKIPTQADYSSEFRYRHLIIEPETLVVAISQSGETADTKEGVRIAKQLGLEVLAILNVVHSSIGREADYIVPINAGQEIGVASTKAYTAQLFVLSLIALEIAFAKELIDYKVYKSYIEEIKKLPYKVEKILEQNGKIKKLAEKYYLAQNFMFLGRGINYPTALEGALKLKEISYIHATGYAAGEMKHGPLALVDRTLPVICINPRDSSVYYKMLSNMEEVKSRQGRIISIATEGDNEIKEISDDIIYIPSTYEIFTPILAIVPLQLFAYHVAVLRGCDVDKPRNLAKSVTVE